MKKSIIYLFLGLSFSLVACGQDEQIPVQSQVQEADIVENIIETLPTDVIEEAPPVEESVEVIEETDASSLVEVVPEYTEDSFIGYKVNFISSEYYTESVTLGRYSYFESYDNSNNIIRTISDSEKTYVVHNTSDGKTWVTIDGISYDLSDSDIRADKSIKDLVFRGNTYTIKSISEYSSTGSIISMTGVLNVDGFMGNFDAEFKADFDTLLGGFSKIEFTKSSEKYQGVVHSSPISLVDTELQKLENEDQYLKEINNILKELDDIILSYTEMEVTETQVGTDIPQEETVKEDENWGKDFKYTIDFNEVFKGDERLEIKSSSDIIELLTYLYTDVENITMSGRRESYNIKIPASADYYIFEQSNNSKKEKQSGFSLEDILKNIKSDKTTTIHNVEQHYGTIVEGDKTSTANLGGLKATVTISSNRLLYDFVSSYYGSGNWDGVEYEYAYSTVDGKFGFQIGLNEENSEYMILVLTGLNIEKHGTDVLRLDTQESTFTDIIERISVD